LNCVWTTVTIHRGGILVAQDDERSSFRSAANQSGRSRVTRGDELAVVTDVVARVQSHIVVSESNLIAAAATIAVLSAVEHGRRRVASQYVDFLTADVDRNVAMNFRGESQYVDLVERKGRRGNQTFRHDFPEEPLKCG